MGGILLFEILFCCALVVLMTVGILLALERKIRWLPAIFLFDLPPFLAIPTSIVGLPPAPSWFYNLTYFLALVAALWLVYLRIFRNAPKARWKRILTNLLYGCLCAFLLCAPFVTTTREGFRVFNSTATTQPVDPAQCPAAKDLEFIHASDLHIVVKGTLTRDHTLAGNSALPWLKTQIQTRDPQMVLLTGDSTDGGDQGEWDIITKTLGDLAGSTDFVLCPGNHDFNPVFLGTDKHYGIDLSDAILRARRYFHTQAVFNARVTTWDGKPLAQLDREAPVEPEARAIADANATLSACYQFCGSARSEGGRIACETRCDKLLETEPVFNQITKVSDYWFNLTASAFPLLFRHGPRLVIVLDTVSTAPEIVGRNALGSLSNIQMEHLAKILAQLTPETQELIFIGHHPFVRPGGETLIVPWSWAPSVWQNSRLWAFSLLSFDSAQANRMVQLIQAASQNRRVYVLFGHRHVYSLGKIGSVEYAESPNLASTDHPGFFAKAEANPDIGWCPR